MHNDGNNIFDKDNAFDFIMNKECEKRVRQKGDKGGCFGVVVLLLIPIASTVFFGLWGIL